MYKYRLKLKRSLKKSDFILKILNNEYKNYIWQFCGAEVKQILFTYYPLLCKLPSWRYNVKYK